MVWSQMHCAQFCDLMTKQPPGKMMKQGQCVLPAWGLSFSSVFPLLDLLRYLVFRFCPSFLSLQWSFMTRMGSLLS